MSGLQRYEQNNLHNIWSLKKYLHRPFASDGSSYFRPWTRSIQVLQAPRFHHALLGCLDRLWCSLGFLREQEEAISWIPNYMARQKMDSWRRNHQKTKVKPKRKEVQAKMGQSIWGKKKWRVVCWCESRGYQHEMNIVGSIRWVSSQVQWSFVGWVLYWHFVVEKLVMHFMKMVACWSRRSLRKRIF